MRCGGSLRRFGFAAALASAAAAAPLVAGGFSVFEQGTKAMGMAGAFTAQADDPSAMFHNVGGLAFQDERRFAAGFTWITAVEADFSGLPPGFGTGVSAEQETLSEFPPHFYWVEPLSPALSFGLAINAPFGLKSDWRDKDAFAGRFISEKAGMRTLDLNPNLGWRASDKLGLGVGLIVRFSDLELNRRLAGFDPSSGQVVEVARAALESDFDEGIGWQAGLLHRASSSFSWGFSYRSGLTVEYGGAGRLTQTPTGNPQLDQLIAVTLPLDQELAIATEIEFPAMASFGVAIALGPDWLLEVDANWAGWSSFDVLRIVFPQNPELDLRRVESWHDANSYRLGLRWRRGGRGEWRFGYYLDESPQPDESVSPLLPDADRDGFTIGYGHGGDKVTTDLAFLLLAFEERSITTSRDFFNGTYKYTGWIFGVTVSW